MPCLTHAGTQETFKRIISTSRFDELRDEIMRGKKMVNINVRKVKNGADDEYVIDGPYSDRYIINKLTEAYNENID